MLGVSWRGIGLRWLGYGWVAIYASALGCATPPAPQPPSSPGTQNSPGAQGSPGTQSSETATLAVATAPSIAVPGERRKFVAAVAPIVGATASFRESLIATLQTASTPYVITEWHGANAPNTNAPDTAASLAGALASGRISAALSGDVTTSNAPTWALVVPRDLGEFVPQRGDAKELVQTRVLPSRPWQEISPLVTLLFTAYAYALDPDGVTIEQLQPRIDAVRELASRAAAWSVLDRSALLRNYGYALVLLGQHASQPALLKSGAQALGAATNLVITGDRWAETAADYADAITALGTRTRNAALLSEALGTYPEVIRTLHRQQRDDAAEHARFAFAFANVAVARFAKRLHGEGTPDGTEPVVAGSTMSLLGKRPYLSDAEFTFRALLDYFTRDRTPLRFVTIQENLAALYWFAAADEDGTDSLRASIAASLAALGVVGPAQFPTRYVDQQRRLAATYNELALRTELAEGTTEAVLALRAALAQLSEQRAAERWAAVQSELGNALILVARREPGTQTLEDAATAYRSALRYLDQTRNAVLWVQTQSNLGSVLRAIAERSGNVTAARDAAAAHQLALSRTPREQAPERWALAQTELGWSLTRAGELERSSSELSGARDAFRAALEVRAEAKDPVSFAQTGHGLAEVERLQAQLGNRAPCEALARYVALHQLAQRHGLRSLDQAKSQTERTLAQRPVPSPAACPALPTELWTHVERWFAHATVKGGS